MSSYKTTLSFALIAVSVALSACSTTKPVPFAGTSSSQQTFQTTQASIKGQGVLPCRPQDARVTQEFSPLRYFSGEATPAPEINAQLIPVPRADLSRIHVHRDFILSRKEGLG